MRKLVFVVSDQVRQKRAVQPQKMASGLKFWITVVEGPYYPYSENKGADQLRSYCAADMHLCFRIMQKSGFVITRLIYNNIIEHICLSSLFITSKLDDKGMIKFQ